MTDGRFKKGQVPWNKGKKGMQVAWNKGKSPSKETVKKQNESWMKTFLSNPEVRRKMSESHKGQVAWNKGKKTGKPAWNRGIPMSEEQKTKVSLAKKGSKYPPRTEEHRRKLSEVLTGKESPLKGIPKSEETKRKIALANTGKKRSEDFKKRMSIMKTGQKYPGVTEQRRRAILKRFESGTFPKKTHTQIELAIKEELIRRGYKEGADFIHQYLFNKKFSCDFAFPEHKLIVEADGDYWHCNPEKYPGGPKSQAQLNTVKKDAGKKAYIQKVDNGSWTFLPIWGSDIKKDVVKCVDKIEKVLISKSKI